MQTEQFEILLQMQVKLQTLRIAYFEDFEVLYDALKVLVVCFCEVLVQEICCAEMLHPK